MFVDLTIMLWWVGFVEIELLPEMVGFVWFEFWLPVHLVRIILGCCLLDCFCFDVCSTVGFIRGCWLMLVCYYNYVWVS